MSVAEESRLEDESTALLAHYRHGRKLCTKGIIKSFEGAKNIGLEVKKLPLGPVARFVRKTP